ncbi:hypothetical protein EKL30_02685 [Candidimonas sp. SYP-B2681]|uniref:hypothetical protein n=1 Tax=Candidimonas sp. SYP-B2681 TaxID=2497686 RepID=UPI000F87DD58|nr:hypothetical protein [Candidimonas sp. SYP-B2681]RTZ47904.1 hypothetical protein EKL30_02685 [Candidimonas sp. SYP-B2681]
MNVHSHIVETLQQGVVLDVSIEDLHFRAYVVLSEPDINLVADFVPPEQFEQDGDVHVAAISHPDEVHEQIQDITFNMNPGDAAVFMCSDQRTYLDALEELGQSNNAIQD